MVDAPDVQHLVGIAAAQLPVAFGREVQEVEVLRATVGGDGVGGGNDAVQGVDGDIVGRADAAAVGRHYLSGEQRHVLGFQVQVFEQAFIDGFHVLGPLRVGVVGLSLVQQDAGNHALSLGDFAHFHQTLVRMSAVGRQHGFHPFRRGSGILVDALFHVAVDADSADSHVHHAHLMVLGEILQQRAAEVIYGSETGGFPAQGRQGLVPLAHLAALVREVHGGQVQETLAHAYGVDGLDAGVPLHVGLAEAEENVELGILCGGLKNQQGGREGKQHLFHS